MEINRLHTFIIYSFPQSAFSSSQSIFTKYSDFLASTQNPILDAKCLIGKSESYLKPFFFLKLECVYRMMLFSCKIGSDSFTTPQTIACQALLSIGFPRQEYLSGLQFPSPGDLPNPGIKPTSPPLVGGSFTTEPPGKPKHVLKTSLIFSNITIFILLPSFSCYKVSR